MPQERIRLNDLEIRDAHIFAKNFKGQEKKKNGRLVNKEGTRTFCVEISSDIAQDLRDDGWNISMRLDQENNEMFCYLPVELRFSPVRPDVYAIVNGVKRDLDETQVHQLDQRKFRKVDLVVHPHWWFDDNTNEWRVKAFLAEGWFYIQQSRFAEEWENRQIEEEAPFN